MKSKTSLSATQGRIVRRFGRHDRAPLAAVLLTVLCLPAGAATAPEPADSSQRPLMGAIAGHRDDSIARAVAGSWRSPENRARDRYRHPLETLAFFGVGPNQSLIEITPGAGWYSEILAPALKTRGRYTAAVMKSEAMLPAQREYAQKNRDGLRDKFAADPERYGAAKIVEFDPKAPILGEPASADIVLSFRNVHNWVQAGTQEAMFKAFFAVLKPGGILGIVDHRADAGTPLDKNSGYLSDAYVVNLAVAAGFRFDGRSEVNANPRDTKDYPKGVWTLPPTYALGDQDRQKYTAIGESDRFTLRFVKPVTESPAKP